MAEVLRAGAEVPTDRGLAYPIVVGVPATPLGERVDDLTRAARRALRWWDGSAEKRTADEPAFAAPAGSYSHQWGWGAPPLTAFCLHVRDGGGGQEQRHRPCCQSLSSRA